MQINSQIYLYKNWNILKYLSHSNHEDGGVMVDENVEGALFLLMSEKVTKLKKKLLAFIILHFPLSDIVRI